MLICQQIESRAFPSDTNCSVKGFPCKILHAREWTTWLRNGCCCRYGPRCTWIGQCHTSACSAWRKPCGCWTLSWNYTLSCQCKKNRNCRNKDLCPLDGVCLANNILYKATVTSAPYDARVYKFYAASQKRDRSTHPPWVSLNFILTAVYGTVWWSLYAWNSSNCNITVSILNKYIYTHTYTHIYIYGYSRAYIGLNACNVLGMFIVLQPITGKIIIAQKPQTKRMCFHRSRDNFVSCFF